MESLEPPLPVATRRRSSVLGYEQSLMFGRYSEQLATFARYQAQKAKEVKEERVQLEKLLRQQQQQTFGQRISRSCRGLIKSGGNWVLLTTLGIIIALLSFIMDIIIHNLYELRDLLSRDLLQTTIYQLLAWTAFTVTCITLAAVIVKLISPQAAGSGVGEMKVILRGVVLKEYLSFKTLCAKTLALPLVLGSGLPLGKEGPFVHISAMVVNQILKIFGTITSESEYESRFLEVIAVACAVGVASTFAAPVGGVLYSIEIVSVFFSVRSYWQGFFAATWGALLWRLLTVWFNFEENITHVFKTDFRIVNPYETLELFAFALLGVLCGLSAYIFVTLQRQIVLFNRKSTAFHAFLQKNTLIYPILVTTIVAVVSFPGTFGQFYGSWLSSEQSMHQLFSNETWGIVDNSSENPIIDNWRTEYTSIYTNTFLFFVMNFLVIALTSTMPVPLGLIVPSFKIGAGLGRCYGEWLAHFFPHGLNPNENRTNLLIVGAYSVAGSAAFAGANTGALSSAVIAFEMTGQLTHLLPIIVATIVATIIAQSLGPSIYDSLIKLKKLPYLPPIMQSSSVAHKIFVEDFMRRDLLYVWEGATYRYVKHLVSSKKQLNVYPFVNSPDSLILLGTVNRFELESLLEKHLNKDRMAEDLSKMQSQEDSECPVHGKRFNVVNVSIPEDDSLEYSTIARHAWEEDQLDQTVNFSSCLIEPAPFQLVEGTTLMRVSDNMFSLLGLQVAYVTSLGRLIGVVALKEVR
ncbi:chloride channel protein 2-like protein [Leptotrombidium deliense]|uniref:Chloride channel protein 2-like protein n=1 Tax=Leptotrombidium deliense TaxID=299467 RepID=A0A443SUT2_9ACAR|nr:chloride channel protein 2-like protein [Leptotrombidium deliense]